MSNKNSNTSTSGISTLSLLGVAFIILKLCNVISWSWWWVTLPFWGGAAFILFLVFVLFIVALITD